MVKNLCSLSFVTTKNYEQNLQTLLTLINQIDENSIIVAPEVCLTGFDYDNLEDVLKFANKAIEALKEASKNKIIIMTLLDRKGNEIYNFAKVFYNKEIVKTQAKAKLFRFGSEHHYMQEGRSKDISIIEIDGVKLAILICFELRFKELWQKVEGADVVATPSWWGHLRTENFKILTQALAIINQCYVVASDSLNEECTGQSGIITPFGEVKRNNKNAILSMSYDAKEIKKMRKYLDVGIKRDA